MRVARPGQKFLSTCGVQSHLRFLRATISLLHEGYHYCTMDEYPAYLLELKNTSQICEAVEPLYGWGGIRPP